MSEKRTPIWGSIYFWLMVVFLYLPILVLILFSFNDSVVLAFPFKGFTLKWYQQMLEARELLLAARNSIFVGVISSLVATMVGAFAAIAVMRRNLPFRNFFLGLSTVPMVMPSIVLGVALLVLLRRVFDFDLSLWWIGAAHVLISIPTSILIVMARLANFSHNLEEASMDLGANYWLTIFKVTLPVSFPALIASFLTAFTTSFDEYAMTTLITGTDTTLPVYLYSLLRFPRRLPIAVAMGSLIMVLSGGLVVLAEWLRAIGADRANKRRNG